MAADAIAIITARGGSTRVPRKNARLFCGLPMVAWPARAAKTSGLFSRVIISTDDEEIAAAALGEGAERPFSRPAHLADSKSNTQDVLKHDLGRLQSQDGHLPPWCCCLYGTSAFVTAQMLIRALHILEQGAAQLVMAITRYSHPIERALQPDAQGLLRYRWPEFALTRTQDIQPSFYDAGLFYFFDARAFMANGGSFQPLTRAGVEVASFEAVDIDTEDDWQMAEKLAALLWRTND